MEEPKKKAPLTRRGKPVEVHYVGVFNHKQELIGDAIRLYPPAIITVQYVEEKMGFQLHMPKERPELSIVLSRPEIVGVALINKDKQFLAGLSIPGRPEDRKEDDVFVLRSRYIIMAPKKQAS